MSLGPGRSGRRNGPQVEQRNWTKGSKNTWATHNVLDKMPHTRVGKANGSGRSLPSGRPKAGPGGPADDRLRVPTKAPANMNVVMVPALVGQPMDQMGVAVIGEDHRSMGGKEAIEIRIADAVGMDIPGLQRHQVDHIDDPDPQVRKVPAQ